MTESFANLRSQLNTLVESFQQLGVRLADNARVVLEEMVPPDEALVEQITVACREFSAFREAVIETANSSLLPEPHINGNASSLRGFEDVIGQIERKHTELAELQRRATGLLDDVGRLRYCGLGELPELRDCQERAQALRTRLTATFAAETLPEIRALANRETAFADLLDLIVEMDSLDSDRATTLSFKVEGAFGRRLVVAALRGQIRFTDPPPSFEGPPIHPPGPTGPTEPPAPSPFQTEASTRAGAPTVRLNEEPASPTPAPTPTLAAEADLLTSPETVSIETISFEADEEPVVEPAVQMNGGIRITEELTGEPFMHGSGSAREIACALLGADKSYQPETLLSLLWHMLAESRFGLAYHLSLAMERVYPDLPHHLQSHLIRPLALGRQVRYDMGEIASLLQRDLSRFDEAFFDTLDDDFDHDWSLAINLLLAASVLRPALLAPSTQAENVLASVRLSKDLNGFAKYCRAIFDFTVYRQPFDPRLLAPALDLAAQQAETNELIRIVKVWYGHASRVDLKNNAVQKVWLNWLSAQGKIGSLLLPITQNDLRQLPLVQSELAALADETTIESEVLKALAEVDVRDAPGACTPALERIRKHTREALAFAQHWVESQQSYLRQQRDEPFNRTCELSAALTELRDEACESLESFKRAERSQYTVCAAQLCLRAINELDRLLTGVEEPAPELSAREILNADLLRISEIPLNSRWEPDGVSDNQILRGVIETIADTRFDWQKAYEMRAQREDHEATMRIIEYLSGQRNPSSSRISELIAERDRQLQQSRNVLHSATDIVRQKIEAALIADWLGENERAGYIARVGRIERAIPTCLRLFDLNERLKNLNLDLESLCARMRAETESRLNREIETLRQQVESLRMNLKDADHGRILAALDDGDAALAGQYLRLAIKGEDLPINYQEPYHLKAFFPDGLKTITMLSNSILDAGSLLEDARNLSEGDSLNDAVYRAVNAWEIAKPGDEELRNILDFLGFDLHEIEPYRTRIPGDLLLTMSLKAGSGHVPAPKYGSDAHNQYRLVCLRDEQSPEVIATLVNNTPDNTPAIVFYFGTLIEEQRRKLARQCNENRMIFLVLDDLLLLHLSKLPAPRTEAFFHCTLPFSFSNPYDPDRPTPPEMFFGRDAELNKLLDMRGSLFVFGGRRAGKTSLLVEAKRRFDRKGTRGDWEQLAVYLDLKAENIGTKRPLDYLWEKLSDSFIEASGASEGAKQNAGASLIFSLVRKWLDGDEHRKLIFLLDDADIFLRLDGTEGFVRCNRLTELMDEPGYRGRFKIVFAGGHDVLRASRVEGHPLVAPDSPLRLEPLYNSRENVQAAIQLIEQVFASIGYEFEKPELIMQILSLTDYHPNLIQLFCQHLIKHVTGSRAPIFDSESSPPYVIRTAHLQEAFKSADLMKRVRECLRWTLELDKRYLVIAQILAHHDTRVGEAGFDVAWIRRQALALWPEGFHHSSSIFDLRGLLEEMTELGLLHSAGDRYRLRSQHLVSRLGAQDESEDALANNNKLVASPLFEAAFSRRPYNSQVSRRSPLTLNQFHQIRKRENGVSIIFGCKAAELDTADLFLAHALPQEFICMNKYASRGDFVRTLSDLRQKPQVPMHILYIPADCLWDEEWMAEALRYLDRMPGNKIIRVVFAADPTKTWRWLTTRAERRAEFGLDRVQPLFSLTAWHDSFLRVWLEDLGIRAEDHERAEITDVTGNYPVLLERFYKAASADLREWRPYLEAMKNSFNEYREELGLAFGLHVTEPATVLRAIVRRGQSSVEDLAAATGLSPETVAASLDWADLLGYILPVASKEREQIAWQPTPLMNRLLSL